MVDDITCRLNNSSITRVYSVSLPAFILYVLEPKKSSICRKLFRKFTTIMGDDRIEVKIPKEIRQYKESIFFGLSARQFFCTILAVGIAAGVYLLFGPVIGRETASWLCIVLAAPAAMAGFFSYNGMNFEQFLWAVIKSEVLYAGERRYIGENIYYNCFNRKGRGDFD